MSARSKIFEAVVAAMTGQPGVIYGGKGFGATALKVAGRIFAMLSSSGEIVVRLPADRVRDLVREGRARHFTAGRDRKLKEWAIVSGRGIPELAQEAYSFVRG